MAPKDAKKRMKAEQNKKQKLQTTTDPTPCKTVSNPAPSLKCKCSIFRGPFLNIGNFPKILRKLAPLSSPTIKLQL